MTAALPTVGDDNGFWGDKLSEFLLVSHNDDGTFKNVFVGDTTGTNDVSASLQAKAVAVAAIGLPLIIPPGNYKITTALTSYPANQHWIAPLGARFFRNGGVVHWATSGSTYENITFDQTLSGSSGAIAVDFPASATKVTFRRCRFTGLAGTQLVNVNNSGITDVHLDQCWLSGATYGFLSNSSANDLRRVKITNCHFASFVGDPIEFNHPSGSAPAAGDFLVDGCVFTTPLGSGTTAGFAIGLAGVIDVVVTNNTIHARREAVHVEDDSRRVTIANNVIRSVTGTNSYAGIAVYPSCREVTITDNTIQTVTGKGIDVIYDGSSVHTEDVMISNNVIRDTTGDGISVAADLSKGGQLVVIGNLVRTAGGNGISVYGSCEEIVVHSNLISGCTGYGIGIESNGGTTAQIRSFRNNVITHCTAGDYQGLAIASGTATPAPNRNIYVQTASSGGGTDCTATLFRLGRYAQGTVTIQARRVGATSNKADSVWYVRWDGTTLAAKRVEHTTSGTVTISSVSLVSGKLTATVAVGATSTQADVAAEFVGVCLEDSTSSSSVSADALAVTGSRGGNAALASLLTKLQTAGIITDSSSA